MYRVAIVLDKVVRNIGYYETFPEFAPPIIVVDITNYSEIIKEGYVYDVVSGKFSESSDTGEPPVISPPIEPTVDQRLEAIEMTVAYTQLQVDYTAFLTELLTNQPK